MEKHSIQQLVKEIVTFDPSLKIHEAELGAFLTNLHTARPHIALDTAFVTNLRREILTAPQPQASPFMNFGTLLFRLAPLGAVALIMLALLPNQFPSGPIVFPDPSTDPRILEIHTGSDVRGNTQPESMATEEYAMSADGRGGAGTMSMDTMNAKNSVATEMAAPPDTRIATADETDDMSIASPQAHMITVPSVTVDEPGFIAVYTIDPRLKEAAEVAPLGVSSLLYAGEYKGVSISLTDTQGSGHTYYSLFYSDNGNGLFEVSFDRPQTDNNGVLLVREIYSE